MKRTVVIEEVVSQEFIVDIPEGVNEYKFIREKYKDGILVVENPALIQANVMICDKDGLETDWNDLHV